MKRFFALLLALPGTAIACGELAGYHVRNLSFRSLPVDQAVSKVTEGLPFKVSFAGEVPDKKVNAFDVSGRLDRVLDELAAKIGFSYEKTGCNIVFSRRNEHKQDLGKRFTLKHGDAIHLVLGDWLRRNGYALYWEAGKYQSQGEISLEKSVEDTLEEVARLMKANGIPIHFEIYENHVIRAVETKR